MTNPIFLLTATNVEYKAAKKRFSADSRKKVDGISWEEGTLSNKPCILYQVPEMGGKTKGSVNNYLAEVLKLTKPTLLIEIGICFGLKDDIKIGDVCICQMSEDYEYQKVNPGQIQNRGRQVDADITAASNLRIFAAENETGYKFGIHAGTYASGEKVVNDIDLKTTIRKLIPEAIVGDMESYSVGSICNHLKMPWLVVKGSSDDGINKGDAFQIKAAKNSVDFIFDAIESNVFDNFTVELPPSESNFTRADYDRIVEEVYKEKQVNCLHLKTHNFSVYLYSHPILLYDWSIIFVDGARSIPEALKSTFKYIGAAARVEVCLCIEDGAGSENRIDGYVSLLSKQECKSVFIKPIREYVFDRVVKSKVDPISAPSSVYIDQKIYIDNDEPVSGGSFIRGFIGLDSNASKNPICVILGQGGVGKTTLCGNIVNLINSQQNESKYLLLITRNEIVKNYNNETIESVLDLYRIFRKGDTLFGAQISENSFDLAFRCGSIVLVIDGIDEIESFCGDQFYMESFIQSISDFHKHNGVCKVVLTSRDVDADRFSKAENIDLVFLKGFSDKDVAGYYLKLGLHITPTIKALINRIRTSQGLVNPYLLRLLVEQEISGDCDDNSIETKYLSLSDPFEYMLCRILLREIEKQFLGIEVDDYYELLSWIALDKSNNVPEDEFEGYLETMLNRGVVASSESLKRSYLKLFLFKAHSQKVIISEEEFVTVIKLKRMIQIFEDADQLSPLDIKHVISVFNSDYKETLGVISRLEKELRVDSNALYGRVSAIISKIKSDHLTSNGLDAKHAIYAIHRFAFNYLKVKDGKDVNIALRAIHGGNTIQSLFVFGDFPLVDFSDLVITNSEFHNFAKFLMCGFSDKSKFVSCVFSKCSDRYQKGYIPYQIFDDTCRLDEGLKHAIQAVNSKADGASNRVKSDLKSILNCMRQGLGFGIKSLNKIKLNSNIWDTRGYHKLMGDICSTGILEFDSKETLYKVSSNFERDALILCEENIIGGEMEIPFKKLLALHA